jgi:hypothetical protein
VKELPRGGFTDVGLHTGGEARPTAGPLVFSALRQILEDQEALDESFSADLLFKKILAYFGLYVISELVKEFDNKALKTLESNRPDILLEHAFNILQSSSLRASFVSDEGLNMGYFVEWSEELRGMIMEKASQASAGYSKQFHLPSSDLEIRGQLNNFSFNIPSPYSPNQNSSLSASEIHKNESQNLGWLGLPESNSPDDVYQWVSDSVSPAKQDALLSMLVLRRVEGLMWTYAKKLPEMEQSRLDSLAKVVDDYREVLNSFKNSTVCPPLSLAQLKSR